MLGPELALARSVGERARAEHWLSPEGHLFWKKPCSCAVENEAHAKALIFVVLDAGSKVSRLRSPAFAFVTSCPSAIHWIAGSTAPVTGSSLCANTLPDQVLVS